MDLSTMSLLGLGGDLKFSGSSKNKKQEPTPPTWLDWLFLGFFLLWLCVMVTLANYFIMLSDFWHVVNAADLVSKTDKTIGEAFVCVKPTLLVVIDSVALFVVGLCLKHFVGSFWTFVSLFIVLLCSYLFIIPIVASCCSLTAAVCLMMVLSVLGGVMGVPLLNAFTESE